MSEPIELQPVGKSAPQSTLSQGYRAAEDAAKAAIHLEEGGMDVVSVWGLGAASWFGLLAVPLLLFPRILVFFAQVPPASTFATASKSHKEHYDALTPLESFLCLSLSLGLLSMSLITLFVLVPSYKPPSTNPSRMPLLVLLVGLTTIMSVISYNTASIGGLGTCVGICNAIIGIWGWWVIVFGLGRGYHSRKTVGRSLR
ncbi:hypothetical protein P7C73_g675, partial [Tremellales sp. Uapishka_1]